MWISNNNEIKSNHKEPREKLNAKTKIVRRWREVRSRAYQTDSKIGHLEDILHLLA